jgi:hypothetical protein
VESSQIPSHRVASDAKWTVWLPYVAMQVTGPSRPVGLRDGGPHICHVIPLRIQFLFYLVFRIQAFGIEALDIQGFAIQA